jgi:hypothetical protein
MMPMSWPWGFHAPLGPLLEGEPSHRRLQDHRIKVKNRKHADFASWSAGSFVQLRRCPDNARGPKQGDLPSPLPGHRIPPAVTPFRSRERRAPRSLETLAFFRRPSPDRPIVNFMNGAKSELKAGAKIIAFVAKQSDGTLSSKRVLVGRDGITPPM